MVLEYLILVKINILKSQIIINKILRGDAKFNKTSMKLNKIKRYFKQNKRNKARIELIEKKLGFNLSKYKK